MIADCCTPDSRTVIIGLKRKKSGPLMSGTKRLRALLSGAACLALSSVAIPAPAMAQPNAAVTVGATDLGGVVAGPNGPEAGVWVIAETSDLPTKYAKIVVTDGSGRYVIPDLPKANYNVWVRG